MSMERVVWEDWEQVLRDTVPAEQQAVWREAVVKFRYWLRETGRAATVEAFREHLAWKKSYLPPARYEERREALRWYWEMGKKKKRIQESEFRIQNGGIKEGDGAPAGKMPAFRREEAGGGGDSRGVGAPADNRCATANREPRAVNRMSDVPTLGKADLGGPPWERKLVSRIREKHLAWKTETTYRHWARRWMRFLEGSGVRRGKSGAGAKAGTDSPTGQARGGLDVEVEQLGFRGTRAFHTMEVLAKLRPKTAGVEPGPPENTTRAGFLPLEGRPPRCPGSFCKKFNGKNVSTVWKTDERRVVAEGAAERRAAHGDLESPEPERISPRRPPSPRLWRASEAVGV